ncbi:MAG: DNA-methyltransferase [Nitrosopumilus sp.]
MSQTLQLNKIIQKDAVDFLVELPPNCVDLVLTDPPYGVDATSWDDVAPVDWCKHIKRVMKDNSSLLVFCGKQNRFNVESALREQGLIFWQEIIWVYRNGGVTRKNSYNGHHEPILWFVKNPDEFYFNLKDKLWIDTWTVINSARPQTNYKKDKKIHPTQKAIDVIKRLIEYHSKEGDLVLDPYMGSGTTAVASKQLQRNFLGCEINKEYVKIAKERLKQS